MNKKKQAISAEDRDRPVPTRCCSEKTGDDQNPTRNLQWEDPTWEHIIN